MFKVTFAFENGSTVEAFANAGDNLLEVARSANVAIDAPCSGEGMFRKDKKMVSAWEEHGPDFFCNIQKSIILQAARMLKQGGMMLYSTCTFDPKENEQVIEHLLKTYPEFRILKIAPYEGFVQGMPEVTESRDPSLADTVRIFPHKMKGEGHYLALVQKGEPCDRVKGELTGGKGKKKLPEELEEFLDDVKKEIRTDLLDIHVTVHQLQFFLQVNELSLGNTGPQDLRQTRCHGGDLRNVIGLRHPFHGIQCIVQEMGI